MFSKIKSVLVNFFLTRMLGDLIKWIYRATEGKKTLLGFLSLLMWTWIYVVPALCGDACGMAAEFGLKVRDMLVGAGVSLDSELLNTGIGLTLVGLLDKIRKMFKEKK